MLPEISLLGLTVSTYVVMLVLAVVVCHWLGPRWAKALEGIEPRKTRLVLVWLGVAAFLGGRAHFLASTWSLPLARDSWSMFRVWEGLHAGGALVALVVATPLVLRFYGLSAGRFADALAPTIGVGIAVARLGCFLNGCCFGTPCEWPWCVTFPSGSLPQSFHISAGLIPPGALHSHEVHPLQLYFAGAGLLATAAAFWVYRRRTYPGRVALVALAVYLTAAAAAEPFRAAYYPRVYLWAGHLEFVWIAWVMAVAALLALAVAETVARRRHADEALPVQELGPNITAPT